MTENDSFQRARRALRPMDDAIAEIVGSLTARRAMPDPSSQEDWDSFLSVNNTDYSAQRMEKGLRTLIDRLLGRNPVELAHRLDVDADELLAQELVRLATLDPRWGFLTLTRRGSGPVMSQQMVMGPGGLYIVGAKNHPKAKLFVEGDKFLVNGQDRPYVPTSRDLAHRASNLISQDSGFDLGVTGIIVPVKDRRLTIEQAPDDVAVMERDGLAEWFLEQPEVLNERQVTGSYSAAREGTSWKPRWSI